MFSKSEALGTNKDDDSKFWEATKMFRHNPCVFLSISLLWSHFSLRRRRRSVAAKVVTNQRPKSTVKKKVHKALRTSWTYQKMCLIIIQSCYFEYRINKPFACSRCVICVSCSICSRDLDVLHAQRIIGFFILIYPQINEVGKSDHVALFCDVTSVASPSGSFEHRLLLFCFFSALGVVAVSGSTGTLLASAVVRSWQGYHISWERGQCLSVTLHMLSPLSKRLFSQAVACADVTICNLHNKRS